MVRGRKGLLQGGRDSSDSQGNNDGLGAFHIEPCGPCEGEPVDSRARRNRNLEKLPLLAGIDQARNNTAAISLFAPQFDDSPDENEETRNESATGLEKLSNRQDRNALVVPDSL